LTDEAKTMLTDVDLETANDYGKMKAVILLTNKLTPGKYRETFYKLVKKPEETFLQFSHRLNVALKYYVESRELGGSYDRLYQLLVADQFKTGSSNVLREQVRIFEAGKWKVTQEMAEQLDIFVSERDAYCPVDKSISTSY